MTPARPRPAAASTPIQAVADALGLARDGRRVRCYNGPGHAAGEDRHPSLTLFPDTNRFQCFACGVRGDPIDLVRGARGWTFRQAVDWLTDFGAADSSRPAPSRPGDPVAVDGRIAEVYRRLSELAVPPSGESPAGRYLAGRGLDPDAAAGLGVRELTDAGAAWSLLTGEFGPERLSEAGLRSRAGHFLLTNHPLLLFYLDGQSPVYVQGRNLDGRADAKELSPAGRRCPVPYNRDLLSGRPGCVGVCEGCIDTLSALQLGRSAVGVPGVRQFRDEWFALFRGVGRVEVLFDADAAGVAAGAELRDRFRMRGFDAEALKVTRGKDLNDLLRQVKGG